MTVTQGGWVRARWLIATLLLIIIHWQPYTLDLGIRASGVYYEELARAFMKGQTHLLGLPDPRMLALYDPWYSGTNAGWRWGRGIHDLSLYHGRFYLQWGPLPAIFLMAWKLVSNSVVPISLFAYIFLTASNLLLLACILKVTIPRGTSPSLLMVTVTILCLFLNPIWIGCIRQSNIYQAPIAFAHFFIALSAFTLCVAFQDAWRGRRRPWLLSVAGLAIGLAIASRINAIFLGFLMPVVWILWCRVSPRLTVKKALMHGLFFGMPALACLFAVFYYNYIRFGNILEFGQTWQLSAWPVSMPTTLIPLYDNARILPNLYYGFLQPPVITPDFPYIRQIVPPFPLSWMSPELTAHYNLAPDRSTGIMTACPIIGTLLLLPMLRSRKKKIIDHNWTVALWTTELMLGVSVLSAIPAMLCFSVMRYIADWSHLLLVAALIVVGLLYQKSRQWPAIVQRIIDVVLIACTLWTTFMGINYSA